MAAIHALRHAEQVEVVQPKVDWGIVWLWVGLGVFGIAELGLAVIGFFHVLNWVAGKVGL